MYEVAKYLTIGLQEQINQQHEQQQQQQQQQQSPPIIDKQPILNDTYNTMKLNKLVVY